MYITYKYLLFLVALSLVGAITQLHSRQGWSIFEGSMLVLGLFLTGIPHGAMDHYIARQQAINAGQMFHIWKFIAGYVFWILLYTMVWWVSPGFSLVLFLLLSAWHFGETDLKFAGHPDRLKFVKTIVYGSCLIAWLLLNHAVELQSWVQLLVPACTAAPRVIQRAMELPLPLFFGMAVAILLPIKSRQPNKWVVWLFFSSFLYLCGKMSLLSGFTLYFTGWHGVLAFVDINNFLPLKGKILAVWRHAIPLSVVSYAFLILIYFFTDAGVWQNFGLPAMFILLSVLTLPHAQVMHQLYRRAETA